MAALFGLPVIAGLLIPGASNGRGAGSMESRARAHNYGLSSRHNPDPRASSRP